MNSEVAWVLVSSGTQVQPQIIIDPDNLPDYLSVSYDMDRTRAVASSCGARLPQPILTSTAASYGHGRALIFRSF